MQFILISDLIEKAQYPRRQNVDQLPFSIGAITASSLGFNPEAYSKAVSKMIERVGESELNSLFSNFGSENLEKKGIAEQQLRVLDRGLVIALGISEQRLKEWGLTGEDLEFYLSETTTAGPSSEIR